MSVLLYSVGAIAFVAGAVAIGFGVPVNEFSFGNTLIVAGTTALVGGLIVVGLGAAVAQLQRIVETMATRSPIRSSRPLDMFEPGAPRPPAMPARVPFPPKPKSGAGKPAPASPPFEPAAPVLAAGAAAAVAVEEIAAPTLRNPDEPPVTVEDDVSLSPQHPSAAPPPEPAVLDEPPPAVFDEPPPARSRAFDDRTAADEPRRDDTLDAGWRMPPEPAPARDYFDAMWPAESKPARNLAATEPDASEFKFEPRFESGPEPMVEQPPREHAPAPAEPEELPNSATVAAEPQPAESEPIEPEPRTVAILKSGVVDGMGYTLYVDGSIEAELPQGTLHFASINELRSHLERNS